MDHVGIVVDDLTAATEFFVEFGLELQDEGPVEGRWVDRVVELDGVRAEIAVAASRGAPAPRLPGPLLPARPRPRISDVDSFLDGVLAAVRGGREPGRRRAGGPC
jgi:catechol 2,3-dioxygenase-like lactoylglutathione lyase family enzyme